MRGVLAHDEVRQRASAGVGLADEPQRHPVVIDADDLRREVQRGLAGKIEVELGARALADHPRSLQKQAAARQILNQAVDNDPVRATLRAHPDRDSYGCPLVHVTEGTLPTYVGKINLR